MFDSLSRGFRMIWASVKMGWLDKRLLVPSILTVFSNIFFGLLIVVLASSKVGSPPLKSAMSAMQAVKPAGGMPTYGLLERRLPEKVSLSGNALFKKTIAMTQVNGPSDAGGMQAGGMGQLVNTDNAVLLGSLGALAWLINRILEGVTTALVYSHLTEGRGSGRFSVAIKAVLCSLPAIVMLGVLTWIARRLAAFMKDKQRSGVLGMSMGFMAGIIDVFWTLAGHLILPAIVIEGCSFWGGLKRADKIAQGSLLTIGIGEVGVELICKLGTNLLYGLGMLGLAGGYFAAKYGIIINQATIGLAGLLWVASVVVATAASIYIRSAFYTCLYVWAIESEAVEETERRRVKPPEPLAMALA